MLLYQNLVERDREVSREATDHMIKVNSSIQNRENS